MTGRLLLLASLSLGGGASAAADAVPFTDQVAPILQERCLSCHNRAEKKGGLSLETRSALVAGGESGAAIEPGNADSSLLVDFVTGKSPEMPKDGEPLGADEITAIRQWIEAGAPWPEGMRLEDRPAVDLRWWSLRPLGRPSLPELSAAHAARARTPVDHFVLAKLRAAGLTLAPEASRRTLARRLYFDLLGLPPSPDQVEAFVRDPDPRAYEQLVDRLLASPRYGERWARYWLDIVHYGDTHGYDKDKLRPYAWPYRDYVIRSLNNDKPYGRFVQEQVAGDVLWPHTRDGVVATGFLAAGPWDFIGHAEVPESKIDGRVARHLDRDDMVRTIFEALTSTTVGCAQCHHHKFDPVSMEDYYGLQAVVAAIDRADREYDIDDRTARLRYELRARQQRLKTRRESLDERIRALAGPRLDDIDRRMEAHETTVRSQKKVRPEFGYHSNIERRAEIAKWVQVDLGEPTSFSQVVLVGCHDNFNDINAGFGFPLRFRIELSNDARFEHDTIVLADHTHSDYPNPGVTPQSFTCDGSAAESRRPTAASSENEVGGKARYIRVTATKLVNRLPADFIFALGELMVLDANGENLARGARVTSLDSIEAPVRWQRSNLVDGYYYGAWNKHAAEQLDRLKRERHELVQQASGSELARARQSVEAELAEVRRSLDGLPPPGRVYAGCVHQGSGNFRGRGGLGAREIFVLRRGQVTQPGEPARPGALPIIAGVNARFELSTTHVEGDRRIALARWLTRRDHPLTWRSVVNRIWQYHFGRGIVDSPNDFGRMGQLPSHPELLDWLATEFRDNGQSLKQLHRVIVCSATYRQSSVRSDGSETTTAADAGNALLWRMNRRKLEAEAIRDSILLVAGKLNTQMYGPGFRDFVLEKPQHSPHYEYGKHDPNDPATHRRSIYRFLVRSQPQPLMDTLDCADPSRIVGKRNETITVLQALSLLNNRFVVTMSQHMAKRLAGEESKLQDQVNLMFQRALGRRPAADERRAVADYAQRYGLANACRMILNLNEFSFVD